MKRTILTTIILTYAMFPILAQQPNISDANSQGFPAATIVSLPEKQHSITAIFASHSKVGLATSELAVDRTTRLIYEKLQQQTENVPQLVKDLMLVQGNWKGTLTYLDYSTGKPYTMSANVDIKRIPGTNKFIFNNIYPKEKSANRADTISISANGNFFDNAKLISRNILSNGDLQLTTERQGTDGNNNRPAIIRLTYTLGKKQYAVRKDVMFSGEEQWIKRHEYLYEKTN